MINEVQVCAGDVFGFDTDGGGRGDAGWVCAACGFFVDAWVSESEGWQHRRGEERWPSILLEETAGVKR